MTNSALSINSVILLAYSSVKYSSLYSQIGFVETENSGLTSVWTLLNLIGLASGVKMFDVLDDQTGSL